jgi:hypothetical protein
LQPIDWVTLTVAVVKLLLLGFLIPAFGTLFVAPTMMIFVRELKFITLVIIAFWATFRVVLAIIFVRILALIAGIEWDNSYNNSAAIVGMFVVGSLITRHLRHYGFPKVYKFPGVGAKVMLILYGVMAVLTLLLFAVNFLTQNL